MTQDSAVLDELEDPKPPWLRGQNTGAQQFDRTTGLPQTSLDIYENLLSHAARRIRRLREWVRSDWFAGANKRERADAVYEVTLIQDELTMIRLRKRSDERDARDWRMALEWVDADAAETQNELLQTLSRMAPIRIDENSKDYFNRLLQIRQRFTGRTFDTERFAVTSDKQ